MEAYERLWAHPDQEIPEGIEVPSYATNPGDGSCPTTHDLAAILQGGCDSGAWMPAVTYWAALETMRRDGDAVLDAIESAWGDPAQVIDAQRSWAAWACSLVSAAVELWASSIGDDLADLLDEAAEDQDEEDN